MLILLVNDDGIDSPLLTFAENKLKKYGEVYTVAPKEQQSGNSLSITIGKIHYEKIHDKKYAIHGTPADCVSFGLFGLNINPDIVVSGVNKGYNLGIDTKYSGTVGAALQANYSGMKAVALSGDYKGNKMIFDNFDKTMEYIIKKRLLSQDYILNINFPPETFEKDKGIQRTRLHYLQYEYDVELEGNAFRRKRRKVKGDIPKDSDIYAVNHGYISISQIGL